MSYDDLSNLFEVYEPRPEYRYAVRVTDANIEVLARHINHHSLGVPDGEGVTALLYNGFHPYLVLMRNGQEVGRAEPVTHYLVSTPDGPEVVKAAEFRREWRRCVGDQWQ